MKKIFTLLISVVCLVAVLCGCGRNEILTIEDHSWNFTVLQDSSGEIIACSPNTQEVYESAIVADFTLEAANGTLTLSDTASVESYDLEYTLESEAPDSTIYTVSDTLTGQALGSATIGITEYDDGGSEYTLIISMNGYSVYFVDVIK